MINKRLAPVDFNMSKKVPPLAVSPFIKAARWSFLISGIFYGVAKLHTYRIHESKIRPLREKAFREKKEKIKEQKHLTSIRDVELLAKDLGITELPPDWEKDI